jgi:transposase
MIETSTFTTGLDLGDKNTYFCLLNDKSEIVEEGHFPTDPDGLRQHFAKLPAHRVAMEVGKSSPWISRELASLGHEVIIANARNVHLISQSNRKNDRTDAVLLARIAKADPTLLAPITHRSEQTQADLALLTSRDQLVSCRVKLVNCVRGLCKTFGVNLKKCSTESFTVKVRESIPERLRAAIYPQLESIDTLSAQIKKLEKGLEVLARERYPVTEHLRTVPGIGPVTAMAFAMIIEDPKRFPDTRAVGAYLGMVPKQSQSGEQDPQLRITKGGNAVLRRLLVSCAQRMLGPFGEDCALQRKGRRMVERGGKRAKKRAVVMMARKLSVMLLAMWKSGVCFEPFPGQATGVKP